MAKKKVFIDVVIDDKGTTERVSVNAKKLGIELEKMGGSARNADRNTKGLAQTSSNGTKNFSKMAQGISGGIVPAYAAFAAQIFALSAAFDFLKRASDVALLRKSQENFAASSGLAMRTVTNSLREASQGMLGFREAAQAAAIGAAKGFSTSQLTALTEGAAKASAALGRNYQDTFDRLLKGVSKAEPELLDELGITLRLEDATKRYADALGLSRDQLTTSQRSQAVYLETMRQLNDTFGDQAVAANPFVQLGKTFEDIRQNIEEKLLPVVESFVRFLNTNADAAIAAFATIGAIIFANIAGLGPMLKGALGTVGKFIAPVITAPFNKVKDIVGKGVSNVSEGVSSRISSSMETVLTQIEEAEKKLQQNLETSKAAAQKSAKAAVQQGAGSKTLGAIALGKDVTPQALGRLKKDLKRVQAEIEETGETSSKAFAGMSLKAVKKLRKEVDLMGKKTLSTGTKIRKMYAKTVVGALKLTSATLKGVRASVVAVGRAAKFTASNMDKIGKVARGAFIWVTVIASIVKAIDRLAETPITVLDAFKQWAVGMANVIQRVLNVFINGLNSLLDYDIVREFLDIEKGKPIIAPFTFADGFDKTLDRLEGVVLKGLGTDRNALQDTEDENRATRELARLQDEADQKRIDRINQTRQQYQAMAKDIEAMTDKNTGIGTKTGGPRTEAIATALTSLPLAGAIEAAGYSSETQAAFDKLFENVDFTKFGGQIGKTLDEAFRNKDIKTLEKLTTAAGTYNSSLNGIKDGAQKLREALSGGDIFGAIKIAKEFEGMADTGDRAAAIIGGEEDGLLKMINNIADTDMKPFIVQLESIRDAIDANKKAASDFQIAVASRANAPGVLNRYLGRRDAATSAGLAANAARLDLQAARLLEKERGDEGYAKQQNEFLQAQRAIDQLDKKTEVAKQNATDLGFITNQVTDSLATNMASAFDGIVQGTVSVKDAFKQMGLSVLKTMSRIITEMLVAKLLMSAFGIGATEPSTGGFNTLRSGTGPTEIPLGGRYGGIMKPYSNGGIARGRDAGYPAILHGTEAVVPLPNGREIPVEMKKSGGDINNVSVNISMDNAGGANAEGTNERMKTLGVAISNAVQEELHKQKRPGGILSPHGAA